MLDKSSEMKRSWNLRAKEHCKNDEDDTNGNIVRECCPEDILEDAEPGVLDEAEVETDEGSASKGAGKCK